MKYLLPAINEWFNIGLELGIEPSELEAIETNKHNEKDRLRSMLSKWLKKGCDTNWSKIYDALKSPLVEMNALAETIATEFLQSNTDDDGDDYDDDDMELSVSVSPSHISTSSGATSAVRETNLSDKDKLSKRLMVIENKFNKLTARVKHKLKSTRCRIGIIGTFCYMRFKAHHRRARNIDELFEYLDRYLSFLNTNLYKGLDREFMHHTMKHSIRKYERHLDKFTRSITVSDFKKSIESLQSSPSCSDDRVTVELRLRGNWDECTVSNLEKLIKFLFPCTYDLLKLEDIHHSILTVVFTASSLALLFLITDISKRMSYIVYRVGIINIQVATIVAEPISTYDNPDPPLIHCSMWDQVEDVGLLLELLHEDPDQQRGRDGATSLILASYNGCRAAVERLLQGDASIDLRADNGATALMMASLRGHLEITRLLLEKEADTSVQDKIGDTALVLSFKSGNDDVPKLLLQHGADPNITRIANVTPLMMALFHAPQLVDILLQYKAKPNKASNNGDTALIQACRDNHIDAVTSLLHHGADPSIAGELGMTPLLSATARGNEKIVQKLLDHPEGKASVNVKSEFGISPLGAASINGLVSIAMRLLKATADPDLKMAGGETALMKAVIHQNQALTRLLILFGANINLKRNDGATALMLACEKRDEYIFKMLLHSGADPNQVNEVGASALMIACYHEYLEIVKLLLQSDKTKLNIPNIHGVTPLAVAAQQGFYDIVQELLENGADPNMAIKDGRTALIIAADAGHHDIVDTLIQHGAVVNTHTIIIGHLDASEMKDKLPRQSYVDLGDGRLEVKHLMTPLLAAITKGHIEVVKILLKAGADINERDPFSGTTSLVSALAHEKPEIAQLLLDSGADVSVRDYDDGTALDVAIELGYNDIAETIRAKMKEASSPQASLDKQQPTEDDSPSVTPPIPTELIHEINSKKYMTITTERSDEELLNKVNRRSIMMENWEPPYYSY